MELYTYVLIVAAAIIAGGFMIGYNGKRETDEMRFTVAVYMIVTACSAVMLSAQPAWQEDAYGVRDTIIGVVFAALATVAAHFYGVFAAIAKGAVAIQLFMSKLNNRRVFMPVVDAPTYTVPVWAAAFVR